MKTCPIYELAATITNNHKSWFRFKMSSNEMSERNVAVMDKMFITEEGNARYAAKYRMTLNVLALEMKHYLRDEQTVFGYWYKDEFYAVGYQARKWNESNKEKKLKSTKELEKLLPLQMFTNNPEVTSGQYYIDDITKKYY